jgi:hypothetical protein
MRGYFFPRTARGRLLLGAYVALEALLGVGLVSLSYPLSNVAQALGYILMAPTTILALPVINSVESRLYDLVGYTTTTQSVTLALLFGLFALVNGVLLTYLRSADGRY